MTQNTSANETDKQNRWTVEVDEELCTGCGNCTFEAPEHFRLNNVGVSEFIGNSPITDINKIIEAAKNCPSQAIIVKNSQTGET